MRRFTLFYLSFLLLFLSGCPFFGGGVPGLGTSEDRITHQERDVSGKVALALGGVADGADEIVFNEDLQLLDFENNDPDLFSLKSRDNSDSFTDGKGAKVLPQRVGIGYVTPIVSGKSRDPIEITIPPQKLIQILIGEARGELDREATLDGDQVKSDSVSVTGDAVGVVIRNRISLINEAQNPGLFKADRTAYEKEPPISYYESVIEAGDGLSYQFSSVNATDPSNPYYLAAANRKKVGETNLIAYDQAVLTAAGIFNDETEDPTGGAFGFYSPSSAEYEVLKEALDLGSLNLPEGAGTSDEQFPKLAPIQILILSDTAPSSDDKDVPSFVFVRSRNPLDPAVTDRP